MLCVETMERRTLLTATLTNGVLTVTGTDKNDVINVDMAPNGKLVVSELTINPESADPTAARPPATTSASSPRSTARPPRPS